jgi:hypothetical protein
MWSDFIQDLRYGARVLLRSRGFAMAAVLTLSIGIGATTAIFSVVNAVLLRPVPFTDIDRLAMVWETDRNTGTIREPASLPDIVDLKERSRQVASFAAFAPAERTITPLEGEPARVPVLFGTHELLPLLGIRPSHGRSFTSAEDVPGGPNLALISDRLWERQFQRAPGIVGQTIRLNDVETTIIGVVPAEADFGTMQILRRRVRTRFRRPRPRSRVDVCCRWWNPRLVRDTHPLLVLGAYRRHVGVAQERSRRSWRISRCLPSNAARRRIEGCRTS